MSKSTIIKLRQDEGSYIMQNGSFKTTLSQPVTINKGDVIQLKNAFLDTATDVIKIDRPIDITISGVRYITNTKEDNMADRSSGAHPGAKIYEPAASYTGTDKGDGLKYFESVTATAQNGDEHCLSFTYRMQANSVRIKATTFKFSYTDLNGVTQFCQYHEPFSLQNERTFDLNEKHKTLGISCRGTSFKILHPTARECHNQGIEHRTMSFEYAAVKPTNGDVYLIPNVRSFTYNLASGLYAPGEIAQILTDEMSRADSNGSIGNNPNIGAADSLFPVNSAFLGTVGQIADEDAKLNTNTKFVAEDGSKFMGYLTSGGAPAFNLGTGEDAYIGASETVLEFDEDTNKMRFKSLHTPLFVDQTTGQANGVPGVQFIGTTGNVALQYSGFAIQNLEPQSFWAEQLGVSAEIIPVFHDEPNPLVTTEAGNPMGNGLGTGVSVHVKSCSQSKEGITTTGAFEGLAISMKTDVDFMQPLRTGDVATDISSTLYFDKIFNSGFTDHGFFMISVGGIGQDLRAGMESNFTGNAKNQDSRSIQAIVGSYFSNGAFTQSGTESSIMYRHENDVPMVLSELETRVLLPTMELPDTHQLGDRNCIFLEVIKSIE